VQFFYIRTAATAHEHKVDRGRISRSRTLAVRKSPLGSSTEKGKILATVPTHMLATAHPGGLQAVTDAVDPSSALGAGSSGGFHRYRNVRDGPARSQDRVVLNLQIFRAGGMFRLAERIGINTSSRVRVDNRCECAALAERAGVMPEACHTFLCTMGGDGDRHGHRAGWSHLSRALRLRRGRRPGQASTTRARFAVAAKTRALKDGLVRQIGARPAHRLGRSRPPVQILDLAKGNVAEPGPAEYGGTGVHAAGDPLRGNFSWRM